MPSLRTHFHASSKRPIVIVINKENGTINTSDQNGKNMPTAQGCNYLQCL